MGNLHLGRAGPDCDGFHCIHALGIPTLAFAGGEDVNP
jgi:hypothetical protein